jgi:drug/metabolite transporter (DMT)-like permease
MKQIGDVSALAPAGVVRALARAFLRPSMWTGLALQTLAFFTLLALLSWAPVSFVVPATAISYAVGAVGAQIFLRERITPLRWTGVVLVCAGVALLWTG